MIADMAWKGKGKSRMTVLFPLGPEFLTRRSSAHGCDDWPLKCTCSAFYSPSKAPPSPSAQVPDNFSQRSGLSMDVAPHPNGIRPAGNKVSRVQPSVGNATDYFKLLPDEIVFNLLQILPSTRDLLNLSHTCKRLYAFSLSEELWKDIYTGTGCDRDWRGTWRDSCLGIDGVTSQIQVPDVYSDLLFKPYLNSQIDPSHYLPNRKSNMIPRFDEMTLEEFERHNTHRPFILTQQIRNWPALKYWTTESLLQRYADVHFRAECVDWTLKRYVKYMQNNRDESPLYLFDSHFAQKTTTTSPSHSSLADDYHVPECFDEDAFKILAEERPDHRWLIVGPARSGSTFHKDPNGTCAWNAVITGSKLWIMLPPDTPPPGVYVSQDESEVTAPLSIAEWLVTYHRAARSTKGFMEGVCGPGEILYVPSGWWHLVVNLDECIAVTQNFVPKAYIGKVLKFLRDKKDQVSGFNKTVKAFEVFDERLKAEYPKEWEIATKVHQSTWDSLKQTADAQETSTGFSFGFMDDESDDD